MKIIDPLKEVHFYCNIYRKHYNQEADRIVEVPEQDYHPYRYFAHCPFCEGEHEMYFRERNLLLAHAKATGPKTPEGIAKSSQNLDGYPTTEQTKYTRFNALKHGIYARVATYFPARPGNYPHCANCDIDREYCEQQPACLKRTELYMRHQIAFEQKDPNMLRDLRSDLQANISAIIDDILHALIAEGVSLKKPEWYVDKDGILQFVIGKEGVVNQIYAHPLLRTLTDFLSKNNLSLSDMGMTPKAQDEHDLIEGHLEEARKENVLEYQAAQQAQLENLQALLANSEKNLKKDPVLIEYKQEESKNS